MKHTLTLFCALLVLGQLNAQTPINELSGQDYISKQLDKAVPESASQHFFERQAARMASSQASSRAGGIAQYLVAYVDAVANSGSSPLLIRSTLWPDSLARIADPDGDFYWFIHALSDMLDPNSVLINDTYIEDNLSVEFGAGKEYQVDTMAFYYLYSRVTPPSIVDTLRVYIFGESNISEQTFSDWPNPGENTDVCYARYNNSVFRPNGGILETYEILLTEADTSSALLARIALSLDRTIGKGNKIGAAFHFISGQSYSLGDLLFDNGTGALGVLNNFELITYEEDDGLFPLSSVTDEGALNQAGVVETDIRYGIDPLGLGWLTTYYPAFGFAAGWRSEHVLTEWFIGPRGAHFLNGTTSTPCEVQFSDLSNVDGITTWLWDFGDGSISLDQNPVYLYTMDGTYNVELEVRDGGGTTFSFDKTVVVANCGTGLDPIDGLVDFTVYPNPVSNTVNLDVTLSAAQDLEVGIYNNTGQLVRSDLLQGATELRGSYDVSDLPAGFYTMKLQNGSQVATKGFVIGE